MSAYMERQMEKQNKGEGLKVWLLELNKTSQPLN